MQGGVHILVAVWALTVGVASGYLSTLSNNGGVRLPSCHRQLLKNRPRLSNRHQSTMLALEEEQEEEDDKEEGGVMTDFLFVSPVQIEFLRKE